MVSAVCSRLLAARSLNRARSSSIRSSIEATSFSACVISCRYRSRPRRCPSSRALSQRTMPSSRAASIIESACCCASMSSAWISSSLSRIAANSDDFSICARRSLTAFRVCSRGDRSSRPPGLSVGSRFFPVIAHHHGSMTTSQLAFTTSALRFVAGYRVPVWANLLLSIPIYHVYAAVYHCSFGFPTSSTNPRWRGTRIVFLGVMPQSFHSTIDVVGFARMEHAVIQYSRRIPRYRDVRPGGGRYDRMLRFVNHPTLLFRYR